MNRMNDKTEREVYAGLLLEAQDALREAQARADKDAEKYRQLDVWNDGLIDENKVLLGECETLKARAVKATVAVDLLIAQRNKSWNEEFHLREQLDTERQRATESEKREAALGAVQTAASILVIRLALVHDDPKYQAVWRTAASRLGEYTSLTYDKEVAALQKALRAALPPDGYLPDAAPVPVAAERCATCGGVKFVVATGLTGYYETCKACHGTGLRAPLPPTGGA